MPCVWSRVLWVSSGCQVFGLEFCECPVSSLEFGECLVSVGCPVAAFCPVFSVQCPVAICCLVSSTGCDISIIYMSSGFLLSGNNGLSGRQAFWGNIEI